jgi:amidase
MRPSVGLVPPGDRDEIYLQRLSTLGPMARSPADLAALLDTMAGPHPSMPDAISLPLTLPEIEADIAGRRIAWLGDWGGAYPFASGILELCKAALAEMSALGLEVDAPAPPHPAEALWEAWTGLRHFEKACALGAAHADPAQRGMLKTTMQWEIARGLELSAADIHRLSSLRSAWFRRATELFTRYDALVLPSAQVWPFPLEEEYPTEIAGRAMDTYHRWMEVVVPASLIGLPVVNLPAGFGENGLPMGMQLIGPRGGDGRLLQIAQAWHRATNWPAHRPPDPGAAS